MSDASSNRPTATLKGIGASNGLTLGRAISIGRTSIIFPEKHLDETPEAVVHEQERFGRARDIAVDQLERILGTLDPTSEQAKIIDSHILMVRDPIFYAKILDCISEERINAEWAIWKMVAKFRMVFDGPGCPQKNYLRERAADVESIAEKIICNLMGIQDDEDLEHRTLPEGSIVVARDLSPADATILLQKNDLMAIVTSQGTKTSHLAILSRARGIPCVVGAKGACEAIRDGDALIVNGQTGAIVINPSAEDVTLFRQRLQRRRVTSAEINSLKKLPSVTMDDVPIPLVGNAETPQQISKAIANGAKGIGLFRTEMFFLNQRSLADEEVHFQLYANAVRSMGNAGAITFRTLDIGADKNLRFSKANLNFLVDEANPALGLRGIRLCLKNRGLFITQLRALLRASAFGPMRIMFPMVTDVSEVIQAKECIAEAKESLRAQGKPFDDNLKIGAMIETPAAVWSADRLAKVCDFFSLGTNDIIQYTLAIDRQNSAVSHLYSPLHIAVLRAIEATVRAAHRALIPVSMCGEMAGDPFYTLLLLGLGLDSLSMVSRQIPMVKRIIRASRADESREFASQVMSLGTVDDAEKFVRDWMNTRFGDFMAT